MHPLSTPLAKIYSDAIYMLTSLKIAQKLTYSHGKPWDLYTNATVLKIATITDFHLPDVNAWSDLEQVSMKSVSSRPKKRYNSILGLQNYRF